jgi:putative FmdB family regulatory protein
MPDYGYRCKKCNKKFSAIHTFAEHDDARVRCPKCKSRSVERTITAFFAKTSRKT